MVFLWKVYLWPSALYQVETFTAPVFMIDTLKLGKTFIHKVAILYFVVTWYKTLETDNVF